jgi:hypothetical protein
MRQYVLDTTYSNCSEVYFRKLIFSRRLLIVSSQVQQSLYRRQPPTLHSFTLVQPEIKSTKDP